MDRREFHKAVLGGAAAVVGLAGVASTEVVTAPALLPLHPGDILPLGATARFGSTRFWHYPEEGNDGVAALRFSPDGRTLAALGYQDGHISLWEVPTGNLLRKWQADADDQRGQIAFSPCGGLLAVASQESLRLWNPHTGQLVRQLVGRPGASGIAFSPDGQLLAGTQAYLGTVRMWEVTTGAEVAHFEADLHVMGPNRLPEWSDRFHCVAFSADGRLLAVGATEQVCLDAEGPEAKELLQKYKDTMHVRKSQPAGMQTWFEGKHSIYDTRGRVWCWDVGSGREIGRLAGHALGVFTVGFLTDGRLWSCAEDGQVWVWDVQTGGRIAELAPTAVYIYRAPLGLAPDGRHALLSRPGSLRLIELSTGAEVQQVPVGADWHGWNLHAVSADIRWVATETRGRFQLWDMTTKKDVSPTGRHSHSNAGVRFNSNGNVVTVTVGEVILWDIQGNLLREIRGGNQLDPLTLALSADGAQAACVRRRWSQDDPNRTDILLWDWQTCAVRTVVSRDLAALVWTADGNSLILGTRNGEIHLLDTSGDHWDWSRDGICGGVQELAVSPDGRWVAALGASPSVHVWDLLGSDGYHLLLPSLAGKKTHNDYRHWGRLGFSPDSRNIVLFTEHGDVCLGPVNGPTLPLVFSTSPTSEIFPSRYALVWPTTDQLLVAVSFCLGDEEKPGPDTIRVFDVKARREVWSALPFPRAVVSLAFSADGRQLVSGVNDGTALLWNLGTASRL